MKAVILAGGLGTRISEETDDPAEADDRDRRPADPLAHHEDVRRSRHQRLRRLPRLQGLRHQGVLRQLLPALVRRHRSTSRTTRIEVHESKTEPWRVTLIDTGEETMTGGRLRRVLRLCRRRRRSASPMATASPTWTSRKLIDFHRAHGDGGHGHRRPAARPLRRPGDGRRAGDRVHREAAWRRRLDQRWLLRALATWREYLSTTTRWCGSASRWSAWRETASCRPTAMTASGSRWTRCRELLQLQALWDSGEAPWRSWA